MTVGERSGRVSIITEVAIDDARMQHAPLRMLVALGTYADAEGWCWPKQSTLADRLGVSRQAVSAAIRALAEWGYVEIHAQFSPSTGARIESRYRVVRDVSVPLEYLRTREPDISPPDKVDAIPPVKPNFTGVGEKFTGDVKPNLTPPVKPAFTSIEEQPKGTTQRNNPKDVRRSDERAPSAGGRVIDLIVAAGLPKPAFGQRDGKALKDTGADPALVAEAYAALFRGAWGDDFMRRNLSIHFVVSRLDAYQSWKLNPKPSRTGNGGLSMPPGAASKQVSAWKDGAHLMGGAAQRGGRKGRQP